MSLEEYNSLNATQHELSSKIKEKRLDSAIEKLKSENSYQKELVELWNIFLWTSIEKTICIARKMILKW